MFSWNYGNAPDKGGWTEVFYPDKETRRLDIILNTLIPHKWTPL